ncbi:hypothetical protein BpHYR1_002678 [Brachionus plicatilis]|uniref:Uncharacterized protein n=1 Tax=Brachionus plicatilis TaxID=10195 RepID=A0A3M7R801_BRAPC|nr:hypothetical protein BpHYR1_002678 [Brachionus plicatilis]
MVFPLTKVWMALSFCSNVRIVWNKKNILLDRNIQDLTLIHNRGENKRSKLPREVDEQSTISRYHI